MVLHDSHGRQFSYLRLSITDICNFRCDYCLPNGNSPCRFKNLTLEEINNLLNAFVDLGFAKVRLTGGEPTVRKDFTDIGYLVNSFPEIKYSAFTTNGYYLKENAKIWLDAGFSGVNISLDSLNAHKFHQITARNCFDKVMAGIMEAINVGFANVKINVVLLKQFNLNEFDDFVAWSKDKPVSIRFIELMETGDNKNYFLKHHVSSSSLQEQLLENGWGTVARSKISGPAIEYTHPNYTGKIGFISPYSKGFCSTCNRLRVSANGNLHMCLFGNSVRSLRDLLQSSDQKEELIQVMQKELKLKRSSHFLQQGDFGITKHLASIGG